MNVEVIKSGNRHQVYIKESYRDENGKPRSRIVQKLGYLEDMLKENPNALEELKAQYAQPRLKREAQSKIIAKNIAKEVHKAVTSGTQESSQDYPCLSYAMMLLRKISDEYLNLNYKLSYLQQDTKYQFNLADTSTFLAFIKILDPQSINSSHSTTEKYMGTSMEDITLDNLYSTYDFLNDNKDEILKWINKKIDVCCNRSSLTMIFYDVTNVFFETALTDEEQQFLRKNAPEEIQKLYEKAKSEGIIDESSGIEQVDAQGNKVLNIELLPPELIKEIKEICFLRMRGMSKEHRFDLPLVSIALVIDEYGFPIDYKLYPGNCSEITKMEPSIKQMMQKYHVNNSVVVADRGLNSVSNLKMLEESKLGFIVAQKISNLEAATLERILDPTDYIEVVKDSFKYKKIDNFVKTSANKNDSITCSLVVTFSEDRYKRDIAVLNKDIAMAEEAVKHNSEIKSHARQWNALVTKEGKGRKAKKLNNAAIEKRRKLCGYAAIVYKKSSAKTASELDIAQISSAYHSLVRIEDCFRIMKTNLSLRPMFVRTENHINAHILCCILALILLRLIQFKLDKNNQHMSIERIIKALQDCNVMASKGSDGVVNFAKISSFSNVYSKDKYKKRNVEEILEILEAKSLISDRDILLKLFNADLPKACNRHAFEKAFSRRFKSDESMIGKVNYRLA